MSGTASRSPRDLAARLALAVLAAITLLALIGAFLPRYDPTVPAGPPLASPAYWLLFGTDHAGRDLLSRLMTGAGVTWLASLAVVAVSVLGGCLLGLLAGAGEAADIALRWLLNLFRVLPAPIMALATAAALGPGLTNIAAALALFGWPWYARLIRAELRAARRQPYMDAVRLARVPAPIRLLRYSLPAALPAIAVTATVDLANAVLLVSLLSFLRLGDPAPAAELGAMTADALVYVLDVPAVAALPAFLVFGMALAANLAGEAFRRRLTRP